MPKRSSSLALLLSSLFLWPAAAWCAESQNATVIGLPEMLSDGARALQFRDYETGVRLTLAGLRGDVSRRNRAAGLSNLCAGYAGLARYDEALEACNQAMALRATRWRVYNNRALAYLGRGQVQAARRDAEEGLALNPDAVTLHKVMELVEVAEIAPDITVAQLALAEFLK